MHHVLGARRVWCATHSRQHLISSPVLGFTRSLQHHPRQRRAHAGGPRRGMAAADRAISVSTVVCGSEPVVKWRVSVEGEPCRFLVLCHLVLGEREYEQAGTLEIDAGQKRFSFRPDPHGVWGRCYPRAVYHLVTSTPGSIERIGGDELLYADGRRRGAGYATLRTVPTGEFDFTVVGSLTDPQRAELLARRHCSK